MIMSTKERDRREMGHEGYRDARLGTMNAVPGMQMQKACRCRWSMEMHEE